MRAVRRILSLLPKVYAEALYVETGPWEENGAE